MREATKMAHTVEVLRNRVNPKKSTESFLPWREPRNANGGGLQSRGASTFGKTSKMKKTSDASNSIDMSSHRQSLAIDAVAGPEDNCPSPQRGTGDFGGPKNAFVNVGGRGNGPSSPRVRQDLTKRNLEYVQKQTTCNIPKTRERSQGLRKIAENSTISPHVQRGEEHSGTETLSPQQRQHVPNSRQASKVLSHEEEDPDNQSNNNNTFRMLYKTKEPCAGDEEEVDELVDIAEEEWDQRNSYKNDDNVRNENALVGSEGETEEEDEVHEEGNEDVNDSRDLIALVAEDETSKRRRRRQAQARREKESQQRRREGRPRNFLLVDEYTEKPYGAGVGAWRKELMLLSRNLDPSVGNINHHPPGAVKEIADWIQHTWEYSAPVRFECVKEVIARGVALRRSEIWKKIRNNEDKPEKLSDRAWRSLGKQLESPDIVKKVENCSRANANRVNFGRTGPSGEIGVRERLRKWLRRSPDPEEINYEMARNKGYGGRSRMNKGDMDVMHGSAPQSQATKKFNRIKRPIGICGNGMSHEDKGHECRDGESEEGDLQLLTDGRSAKEVHEGGGGAVSLTEEQISKHPLVLKLMQRLEALEEQRTTPLVKQNGTSFDAISSFERQKVANEIEEDLEDSEEDKFSGTTERQKRRRIKA